MALKILKALIPVIITLAKDLKDGKLSADEKEALIIQFTTVVAELVADVVEKA